MGYHHPSRDLSFKTNGVIDRLTSSRLVTLWHLSVWERVQLPVAIATAWACFVWVVYLMGFVNLGGGAGSLTGILAMVTGLFVSFRSGSSYDRWYEGRRTWSSIQATSRNTLRVLIFALPSTTSPSPISPHYAGIHELCNLIVAFSVACVHHLRDEPGVSHADLRSLLPATFVATVEPGATTSVAGVAGHHSSLSIGSHSQTPRNLPLVLIKAMHSYANELKASEGIDAGAWSACQGALSQFTDQLTALERIRDTPIPTILQIHLQLLLLVYVGSVPLQLVRSLGFWAIPATSITALVFYGVDRAGEELSDPFGTEPNDLPVARFCADIHSEYLELAGIPAPATGSAAGRVPTLEGKKLQ